MTNWSNVGGIGYEGGCVKTTSRVIRRQVEISFNLVYCMDSHAQTSVITHRELLDRVRQFETDQFEASSKSKV